MEEEKNILTENDKFIEGSTEIDGVVITRKFIQDEDYDSILYFTSIIKEDSRAKPSLLFIHGFGEHSGRYLKFGAELAKLGFNFYTYDCRGFGFSDGLRSSTSLKQYFQDIITVLSHIEKDANLYVMGHSTGGGVLLSFLKLNPDIKFSGVILTNPFINFPGKMKVGFLKKQLFKFIAKNAGVNFICDINNFKGNNIKSWN